MTVKQCLLDTSLKGWIAVKKTSVKENKLHKEIKMGKNALGLGCI